MSGTELGGKTLVVAHALHPLEEGRFPGEDFRSHLDTAADVFSQTADTTIYVPGSWHRGDEVSLADAGTTYLEQRGIPRERLRGTDWNDLFRAEQGVYCGADEAEVAVRGLRVLRATRLVAICSPGQVARLSQHYEGFQEKYRNAAERAEVAFLPVGTDQMHGGITEKVLTAYTRFDPRWDRTPLPALIRFSRRPRSNPAR